MRQKTIFSFFFMLSLVFSASSSYAYNIEEWTSNGWENYPAASMAWEVVVKNGDNTNWNVGIYQPGGAAGPVAQNAPGEIDWYTHNYENPFTLEYNAIDGIVTITIQEAGTANESTVSWNTGLNVGFRDLYILAKSSNLGQNTIIEDVYLNNALIGDGSLTTNWDLSDNPDYTKAGWHITADPGEAFSNILIAGKISFDAPEDPQTTGDSEFNALFGVATPVPVPAALWLLGSGLMGLAAVRKTKQR